MKLRTVIPGLVAACATVLMPTSPLHAQDTQDSALLDALVKKGVLSDQEAEDVRASEEKSYSSTAASKINLSSSIKSITFYGDLRLRYELRDGTVQAGDTSGAGTNFAHNDSQTRSRYRFRLRFGFKGDLYNQFFYGVRAATGQTYDRSGNITFGNTDNGGEFGNTGSTLSIDQVYLGWKPTDYLTLTGGKMPNPLYATNMIWDDNLSPTGAAEQFDKTSGDWEVFATAGQFVYGDSADNAAFTGTGVNYDDVFMFAEQVGFKVKFDDNTFFKAAATMYTYSGTQNGDAGGSVGGLYSSTPINLTGTAAGGAAASTTVAVQENNSPSYFTGPFVGAASASESNVTGINNLAVMEVPMEFDFKAWNVPMRAFADVAYNFEADQRADAARRAVNAVYNSPTGTGNVGVTGTGSKATTDALINSSHGFQGVLGSGKGLLDQAAYQVGFEAGQLKKKGDWDGKVYWQSTGYYAVDPNLVDADIFNAATNMQGAVVAVSHNWTDGISSTLRYAHGVPVNSKMATPNVNQDLQLSDIHEYNLFQADLMWKF
jgi:hypothetical protein